MTQQNSQISPIKSPTEESKLHVKQVISEALVGLVKTDEFEDYILDQLSIRVPQLRALIERAASPGPCYDISVSRFALADKALGLLDEVTALTAKLVTLRHPDISDML